MGPPIVNLDKVLEVGFYCRVAWRVDHVMSVHIVCRCYVNEDGCIRRC